MLRKLGYRKDIQSLFDVIQSVSASIEEVTRAGCSVISMLYGGCASGHLNHLYYTTYMHMCATGSQIPRPERLPPAHNAAKYHVLRLHVQVVQRKLLSTTEINPLHWGWKLHGNKFTPVPTDMPMASSDILKVICCKCMIGSNTCATAACSCRKFGMSCIASCKDCCGVSCDNVADSSTEWEIDDNLYSEGNVCNTFDDELLDDDVLSGLKRKLCR